MKLGFFVRLFGLGLARNTRGSVIGGRTFRKSLQFNLPRPQTGFVF